MMDSSGVSSEPVAMTMADLEDGKEIPDRHLVIGEHMAVYDYDLVFYQVEEGRNVTADIPPDAKVTRVYYPIVTPESWKKYRAGLDEFGNPPPGEDSKLKVRALVKCNKFGYGRDLPNASVFMPELKGMTVASLSSEDEDAINDYAGAFEFNVDKANLVIIEEGDGPWSFLLCGLMILGGLALIVGGIGAFAVTMFGSN